MGGVEPGRSRGFSRTARPGVAATVSPGRWYLVPVKFAMTQASRCLSQLTNCISLCFTFAFAFATAFSFVENVTFSRGPILSRAHLFSSPSRLGPPCGRRYVSRDCNLFFFNFFLFLCPPRSLPSPRKLRCSSKNLKWQTRFRGGGIQYEVQTKIEFRIEIEIIISNHSK